MYQSMHNSKHTEKEGVRIMRRNRAITAALAAALMAALLCVTSFAAALPWQSVTPDITEEKAQEIAFADSKVDPASIELIKSGMDYDDGWLKYEIDFWSGETKYEYDIDAKSGEIIKFSREILYKGYRPQMSGPVKETLAAAPAAPAAAEAKAAAQPAAETRAAETKAAPVETAASSKITYSADSVVYADGITSQEALQIALKHAGVKESDITRPEVGMDYEQGRKVYEIGFNVGWTEYDYDIDVNTGEIVKYSIDIDD